MAREPRSGRIRLAPGRPRRRRLAGPETTPERRSGGFRRVLVVGRAAAWAVLADERDQPLGGLGDGRVLGRVWAQQRGVAGGVVDHDPGGGRRLAAPRRV